MNKCISTVWLFSAPSTLMSQFQQKDVYANCSKTFRGWSLGQFSLLHVCTSGLPCLEEHRHLELTLRIPLHTTETQVLKVSLPVISQTDWYSQKMSKAHPIIIWSLFSFVQTTDKQVRRMLLVSNPLKIGMVSF